VQGKCPNCNGNVTQEEGEMTQMVPLKKQSKRAQKEYHARQRGSWNGLNPVTRVVPNGKAYDRNKAKRDMRDRWE